MIQEPLTPTSPRSRSNSSKHGSGAGGPPLSNPLRENGMTGSYNCRELGGRSRHGSGTASSSCGSQANIYNPLTLSKLVLLSYSFKVSFSILLFKVRFSILLFKVSFSILLFKVLFSILLFKVSFNILPFQN